MFLVVLIFLFIFYINLSMLQVQIKHNIKENNLNVIDRTSKLSQFKQFTYIKENINY